MIVRSFSLRKNSGGAGRFYGGDGVTRELLFRRPLTLSLLTERRVFSPYGMNGTQVYSAAYINLTYFKPSQYTQIYVIHDRRTGWSKRPQSSDLQ